MGKLIEKTLILLVWKDVICWVKLPFSRKHVPLKRNSSGIFVREDGSLQNPAAPKEYYEPCQTDEVF